MKILQICAYSAPYEGNFIKSLKALERCALEHGDETIYCFPKVNRNIDWCREIEMNHIVYYLPLSHARFLPKTYLMLKRIFKENPDIAIAHSHFELYDTPLTLTAPKSVKIFWHLHDAIGTYLHGIYKYIWKIHYCWLSKRAILLSVSEKHKRVVIKLGFSSENAYYEPNAIDTERIRQVVPDRKTDTDFLILGWDYIRKGVDLAEESIKLLSCNVKLGVAGGNVNEQTEIGRYSIVNVTPNNDINILFESTKCFLHISRAEGMSYALLEALYAGLPVIISNIEENMIAKNFPTAFIVKNEDVEEISSAMRSLISNDFKLSETHVQKSRKMIEDNYSIQSWAERIFNDYMTLSIK